MRNFLISNVLLLNLLAGCLPSSAPQTSEPWRVEEARSQADSAWRRVPAVLARIQAPSFAEQEFLVSDYGAQLAQDLRPAVQRAIEACHAAGGGRVVIPPGEYLCRGPIHLRSGVNLHLSEGVTLRFSPDPLFYTPLVKVRWEGTVCYNFSPLIYAYQQKNIALTGKGTIDGQANQGWAAWKGKHKPDRNRLRQMGNDRLPEPTRVFGHGYLDLDGDGRDDGHGDGQLHYLRPTMVEFYECENVLIEDLTLRQSPFWTVHPVFCRNVTIRGLRIEAGTTNDDGIDPDSNHDVLIEDCHIATHDDAISIKAGRDQDAWDRMDSRNIIIRRCTLNSDVNAVCIGSEMSGGVHDVFVEDIHIETCMHGLNFKCNLDRGGEVSQVFARRLRADTCRKAVFIFRMDYHGYRGNHYPTQFHDFYVQDFHCNVAPQVGVKIVGVPDAPIRRVWLDGLTIGQTPQPKELRHTQHILFSEALANGDCLGCVSEEE